MKRAALILIFSCACSFIHAQENIITTIAGTDTAGFGGDGGLAINAKLNFPDGICIYKLSTLYIADAINNRIRKIDLLSGVISTIAGNDTSGFSGDGGLALLAKLNVPEGVVADTAGNIFIADAANQRIRKIEITTGIITTIAGKGVAGRLGDGGPATNAELAGPSGLCLDRLGDLYIADWGNQKIRKVNLATGIITTVAGNGTIGYSGDNGLATSAELSGPVSVSTDTFGNVFVADEYNSAIRKIEISTGIITTIAGNGSWGYSGDNGPATNALLDEPSGIYIDGQNNIYFSEYENGVIRRISGITGIITTVAGNGSQGFSGDNGLATHAELIPGDICLDNYGTIYIADYGNSRIRKVYNPTLGVASPSLSKGEVTIWPNPARDEVTVENAAGSEVSIYNMAGQEVYQSKILSDKQTLNIACISPGVYEVRVINSSVGLWTTKKLVLVQ